MKTVQEISSNTQAKIESYKNSSEVIQKITKILDTLHTEPVETWQPDRIASVLGTLALLKINLGSIVAAATMEYNAAYVYRKFRLATDFKLIRKMVKTNKDAEGEALLKNEENHIAEIQHQYQADTFKTFYEDISMLIMALQSILNTKRDERRESNIYNR